MTLKAQVREGRLVLDEPTDLPEGTEVELTPVLDDDLGPEERQALEASLERSAAQLARDELMDADEVLRRLRRDRTLLAQLTARRPDPRHRAGQLGTRG